MFDLRSSLGMTALDLANLLQAVDTLCVHGNVGDKERVRLGAMRDEIVRIRSCVLALSRQQKA